ncbi:MAG TPA: Asp-tRNA(Asn)/Glu-tRNA(Gln) amidotransferase subunit GatA [Solirubrobacteraceae bacterium]|nr:Asp-tRNA(Asn)/Glu-tRNA(Gln) amidotransferase subunit GatA [Solirubrobacteraceae bacterium]
MTPRRTATEMAAALATNETSSLELLEASFSAIDASESDIHAFISLADRGDLRETAAAIDEARVRGDKLHPFAGIPIAVKDNISVSGHPLTCASRILGGYEPPYTATAVSRLQAAQLLVIGKTNMDEFGFGSSTENSAFFATRNPRALERVPGGTSGGSAAAVAAGFVPWALGTDTGGSVRQPAALCGTVGFRPSYGRVSRYGLVAYSSSMDQIGPLATSVDDVASLTRLMAGVDPCDATTVEATLPAKDQPQTRLRLGLPREYLSSDCQKDVSAAVDMLATRADALGWSVTEISLPLTPYALDAYYIIASVEAASNLARFDGVRYCDRAPEASTYFDMLVQTRTRGFGAEAKRRILLGTFASSAGYEDEYYGRACRVRNALIQEFSSAFGDVDLILSPVSPSTAWPIGERVADPMAMYLSDIYSVPAALAGLPAAVIPVTEDAEGLPIGLQLCGPRMADALVLDAARALEADLNASVE